MTTLLNISDQYDQLSGKELRLFEDRLLENYLNGKMTNNENEWFESILLDKFIENEWGIDQTKKIENLLSKNQNLKSKYQSWINTAEILENQAQTKKIKKLITEQLIDISIPEQKNGKIIQLKSKRNHQYLLLAASIIILFGIGISIWLNFRTISTDKLYAMYYEPYKVDFEISRDITPSNAFIVKAQKSFIKGDIIKTIKYLELTIENEPKNWQQYLNLAGLLMVTEKPEKAISVYKQIPPDAGFNYETALWYMGLCYLKADNREKATEIFSQLKSEGRYFKEKAAKILNKIN